jgi:hypothetical protein
MLDLKPLNRILFLDIETTSEKENFLELSEHKQALFLKRFKKDIDPLVKAHYDSYLVNKLNSKKKNSATVVTETVVTEEDAKKLVEITNSVCTEMYNIKAPIFPEFGRILCISVGVLWKANETDSSYFIKIISFYNEDEKVLLEEFVNHPKLGVILNKIPGKYDKSPSDFWAMCAHNGRVFDFPYIAKRLIINKMKLPAMFDYAHLKPWEQNHIIDTKEAWSFGVWDAAISLDLLSEIFETPSSKDDIDGSQVKDVFWIEKDLPRIAKYCEKDVFSLAKNYLMMKSMDEEIIIYEPVQAISQEEIQEATIVDGQSTLVRGTEDSQK